MNRLGFSVPDDHMGTPWYETDDLGDLGSRRADLRCWIFALPSTMPDADARARIAAVASNSSTVLFAAHAPLKPRVALHVHVLSIASPALDALFARVGTGHVKGIYEDSNVSAYAAYLAGAGKRVCFNVYFGAGCPESLRSLFTPYKGATMDTPPSPVTSPTYPPPPAPQSSKEARAKAREALDRAWAIALGSNNASLEPAESYRRTLILEGELVPNENGPPRTLDEAIDRLLAHRVRATRGEPEPVPTHDDDLGEPEPCDEIFGDAP
jgi:hypothetical protein